MTQQMHKTREEWLTVALWSYLDPHFTAAGYDVPAKIRVTCGFPSTHALARKNLRVGECWCTTMSKDRTFEISVSPFMDDPVRVLGILLHEVVHAVVGLKAGHRAPFSQCAVKVGLTKPWTGTGENDELTMQIAAWVGHLGPYPHAALTKYALDPETGLPLVPDGRSSNPKQTTRMLKLECEACKCIIRTSRRWTAIYAGHWHCPCGGQFRAEDELAEHQEESS